MKPKRLAIAQLVCRYLPPVVSERIRRVIYPLELAIKDDYQFTVRSQTGSLFRMKTSDFFAHRFCVFGYFEWKNTAIALALASEGDTIVEIGANIGTETIGFSDIVGDTGAVYAFEPVPMNIKTLEDNLQLNGKQNVVVLPFAVSDREGKVQFVVPRGQSGLESGLGHISYSRQEDGSEKNDVYSVTLDSLITRIGKSQVIFIDAEGEEPRILCGAEKYIRGFQPTIVLEANQVNLQRAGFAIRDIYSLIKKFNYEAYKITRVGLRKIEDVASHPVHANWVCIPKGKDKVIRLIKRYFKMCGFFPCIPGLNPITKRLK